LRAAPAQIPARAANALGSCLALGANDEALVGVEVQDAGWREPPHRETVHPVPVQVAELAAAPQSRAPVPGRCVRKARMLPGTA
jgi:hypothetical protein